MTRVVAVALATAAAGVLVGFYIVAYLLYHPVTVSAATGAGSGSANVTLQVVPTYGSSPTPDWVSYFVQDSGGNWVHSTYFTVPANSQINMTIYQFDSASGFRNPLWGQARGTTDGTMTVNGKTTDAIDPTTAGHSFSIPDLGLNIPLQGIPPTAKNVCGAGPCDPKSSDHTTVTFSFKTGAPGMYRWQCFVPCAAGFFQGWGGPMQTIGYMDGEMIVK